MRKIAIFTYFVKINLISFYQYFFSVISKVPSKVENGQDNPSHMQFDMPELAAELEAVQLGERL